MTSVQAGEVEAVHQRTTEDVYRQQLVEVQGQTDVLTMGIPYICPYNVHSIMNPILVMCTGLGYFFNMYRGKPLVREGGVVIMSHPTQPDFHPVHHPSYIDFYEQVLADTTDPHVMSAVREALRRGRVVPPPLPHATPTTACTRSTCGTGGPRHAALRAGDHRRRRPEAVRRLGSCRPRRSTTPSRWPPTSSAAPPRSPTSHPADPDRGRRSERSVASMSSRHAPHAAPGRPRRGRGGGPSVAWPRPPQHRLPVPPADRASRCRGAGRAAELGADYDTRGPALRPPASLASCRRGPLQLAVRARPPRDPGPDRLVDLAAGPRTARPRRRDLHPQPPQPPRRPT